MDNSDSEQLKFDIDNPSERIERVVSSARMIIKKRGMQLEISTLWKSPALAFAIVTTAFNTLVVFLGGAIIFDRIPPRIPLLYDSINRKWEQADKLAFFIFAAIVILFEAFLIQISIRVFRFDRRFGLTIWWLLTFLNFLFFLTLSQLYLLVS